MSESERVYQLQDIICELQVAQERADAAVDNLYQDYFELKDEILIRAFHNKGRIMNGIANDYIFQIGELLKKAAGVLFEEE